MLKLVGYDVGVDDSKIDKMKKNLLEIVNK
jgi:hypothetical protein